jgi:hypothetical protein
VFPDTTDYCIGTLFNSMLNELQPHDFVPHVESGLSISIHVPPGHCNYMFTLFEQITQNRPKRL